MPQYTQHVKVKSVRVILRGGLGNQLFQYATGVAESSRRKSILVFDTLLLPESVTTAKGINSWPEQISQFNHLGEIHRKQGRMRSTTYRISLELLRSLSTKWPRIAQTFGVFSLDRETESMTPSSMKNLKIINSYVANSRYFQGYEEEVRSQITSLVEPSADYLKAVESLSSGTYTGVHIRLGDYKNLEHIYGPYSPKYLRACLSMLEESSRLGKVVVFSDERRRATEILKNAGVDPALVMTLPELSPLEELLLLSKCSNILGSNSTFSWWAAFLNNNEEARVFFPRPFYVSSDIPEPKTLLLPGWLQVGR